VQQRGLSFGERGAIVNHPFVLASTTFRARLLLDENRFQTQAVAGAVHDSTAIVVRNARKKPVNSKHN